MTIDEHCKAIDKYCRKNDIDEIRWNSYNGRWSAFIIKGKYHKDAQFVGYEDSTLSGALEILKANLNN